MRELPKLKMDWVGLKVRSQRPLVNGNYKIPAGSEFKVTNYYRGLSLTSDPCGHCGVRVFISKVPIKDVEIIYEST